jgi:beta-1,4-N-acetylglucosaminyltransferase
MILVTVGLHTQPFDRLVIAADHMASLIEEPVVIQRGVSDYAPFHALSFDSVAADRMQGLMAQARVLICHAGAGSILVAMGARKPLVLAPRLRCLGECVDDHQLELAAALARQGRAAMLIDLTAAKLRAAAEDATRLNREWVPDTALQGTLEAWLDETARVLGTSRRP